MAAIALPRLIRLGGGTLNELPEVLAEIGVSRPFVVTDAFLTGSGAVARLTGALLRGGEPAGEGQNGATGLKNKRILAREDLRTTRNPPVHLEQGSQAWTGLAMARGGLHGGAFAGAGVWRFWGSGSSANERGEHGEAHQGLGGRLWCRRGSTELLHGKSRAQRGLGRRGRARRSSWPSGGAPPAARGGRGALECWECGDAKSSARRS